jgi:hypothetical protein
MGICNRASEFLVTWPCTKETGLRFCKLMNYVGTEFSRGIHGKFTKYAEVTGVLADSGK